MSSNPRPRPTAHESGCTRRELLRRGGTITAGAAATTTVGSRTVPRYSPVGRAAAILPAVPIGVAAGAAGIAYVAGVAHERYVGDGRDYSGYTGADALRKEIYEGFVQMKSADERVMTSIENNITNSDNIALAKGKAAIIEEMNAGNGESAAQDAMQAAIDEYYATIQENILTHYDSQIRQFLHHMDQLDTHSDASLADVIEYWDDLNGGWDTQWYDNLYTYISEPPTTTVTLIDGSEVTVAGLRSNPDESWANGAASLMWEPNHYDNGTPITDQPPVRYLDPDDNTVTQDWDIGRYVEAYNAILDSRDRVNADLSGFVTDVYAQYEPGDIPTEDLVDPVTAATELRQDYDNRAGQGAHAAMLGIPTSADFTADLEIQSDEAEDGVWEVTAEIFTNYVPREDLTDSASISSGVLTMTTAPTDGVTYDLTTTDGETVAIAAADFTENADGDWEVDLSADLNTTATSVETLLGAETGFETGTTYQPSEWDKPLYIAYEYVDGTTGEERADFTQIESSFAIVSVTDAEGNDVESFQTRSRNNQTADVSALEEELQQLRQDWIEMQEEAQEQDDSGGGVIGDILGDGAGGPIIGALVVIGAIFGFGQLTS